MRPIDDLIKSYSKSLQVNPDFNRQVFTKIEKRKTLRKITVSSACVLALVLIALSILTFFPRHGVGEGSEKQFAGKIQQKAGEFSAKEEIPVLEEIFFTLYDQENNYAIEEVSQGEEEGI